jgi:hypothetical protein
MKPEVHKPRWDRAIVDEVGSSPKKIGGRTAAKRWIGRIAFAL